MSDGPKPAGDQRMSANKINYSHGLKAWRSSQNPQWLATTQNEIIETEFLIRAMHAKAKVKEIAVEITESRAPRISIYKRIFAMGSELRKLYAIRKTL